MSNGSILLLVLLVGAPLLMLLMHRGGAHGGHGHGGFGGGCGGGGHSGHGDEEPRDGERSGPVLGKPGPQHNHPAPQTNREHESSRHRGC